MDTRPLTFSEPGRFEIYCHHSPPAVYPEETHRTLQVCVPFERAQYTVSRQSETGRAIVQRLGARDALVVPAQQPHAVDWQRAADVVSLQLSESFIAEALGVPRLQLRDTLTVRDPFIFAAARQLRGMLRAEGSVSPAFAAAMATAIAFRAALAASSPVSTRSAGVAPALSAREGVLIDRYVDEHLDEPITLAALAAVVGLSPRHFMRRFEATHGVSPHELITRRRLARAQTLLVESSMTIVQVALEVGMSHSHFSRTFLARFGVSPREYRRPQRR
jgi:AraC family transcriptional regulator